MTTEVTQEDINNILEKWFLAKDEIKKLEKKCDSYKRFADKVMRADGSKSLESKYYRVSRRNQTRTSMSQKNTPREICDKYSNKSTYDAYYITER